jgi:hypothetical protein
MGIPACEHTDLSFDLTFASVGSGAPKTSAGVKARTVLATVGVPGAIVWSHEHSLCDLRHVQRPAEHEGNRREQGASTLPSTEQEESPNVGSNFDFEMEPK